MQRDIFLGGEGKAWIDRNPDDGYDPVLQHLTLGHPSLSFQTVLEIGCGDGRRLEKMTKAWPNSIACGLDPGVMPFPGPPIYIGRGTADNIPFYPEKFDLVIFGFCLYLCDPEDYFAIVAGADRVLKNGGFLVVHDFYHADYEPAFRVPYVHKEGVWSHHAAFWRMWTANPIYKMISCFRGLRDDGVYVMKKSVKDAYITGDNHG